MFYLIFISSDLFCQTFLTFVAIFHLQGGGVKRWRRCVILVCRVVGRLTTTRVFLDLLGIPVVHFGTSGDQKQSGKRIPDFLTQLIDWFFYPLVISTFPLTCRASLVMNTVSLPSLTLSGWIKLSGSCPPLLEATEWATLRPLRSRWAVATIMTVPGAWPPELFRRHLEGLRVDIVVQQPAEFSKRLKGKRFLPFRERLEVRLLSQPRS